MKIEVGKKYLDSEGKEWEVIQDEVDFVRACLSSELNKGVARTYNFNTDGSSVSAVGLPLVSEVPSPATTAPQFKVGDRVRARHARREIEQEFKREGWR